MLKEKDPAFLFYTNDFLTGTADLTNEEVGQYIRLMCYQHQKGHLSRAQINRLIKDISDYVLEKFVQDSDGNYYNKRLEAEIDKRSKFNTKQRENGYKGGRPKNPSKTQIKAKQKPNQSQLKTKQKPTESPRVENENENENVIEDLNEIVIKEIGGVGERENSNVSFMIKEIIDYLNVKADKSFKHSTQETRKLISGRLSDGFEIDDFKKVIDNRVSKWMGTEWEQYLRPNTLFRPSNFENYLNDNSAKKPKTATEIGAMLDEHDRNW